MGCGSAGSPYFPFARGTKTLLFCFAREKSWSAAPTCIFGLVNFVVGHNHKLKTMLWSI